MSSSQSARINKNHRRHSTNTYTSSASVNAGHKELSPSGSLNAGTNYYENTKNLKDGSGSGGNNSSSSSTNQKYSGKKVVKRKKTASHLDHTNNSMSSNASGNTVASNAIASATSGSKNGNNSNTNYLGKTIKMTGTSSR